MPPNRLPLKAYNMLLSLDQQGKATWVTKVRAILCRYGFGYVWYNQGVGDHKNFLSVFKKRLKDCYQQEWTSTICAKDRYCVFSSFKQSLSLSFYLTSIKNLAARNIFIKIRLGVSQLQPHRLRYSQNVPYEERNCPFCDNTIENEIHFMFVCSKYKDIREKYISAKYYRNPSLFRLSILFASENENVLKNVTLYVYKAFKLRQETIALHH